MGLRGRPPGVISANSLARLVITHLHDRPDEYLTAEDISVLFADGECPPSKVFHRLKGALKYGYLERFTDKRGFASYRKPKETTT